MNPALIPLWERHSSLPLKNNFPDSMKPKRKHLPHMNPLRKSWPPGLHDASTLGKLEIRSGLKPLISDYTTLLGNSLPKDMVHSRLLRYYLPSPTNSNYPPYGRYTMCSTPPSYLLIAPLNHMVSPSPNVIDNEEEYEVKAICYSSFPSSFHLVVLSYSKSTYLER